MSTPPAIRKISLPPEALAALNADRVVPLKAPPKPWPLKAQMVIRNQVAKTFFGPSMRPTFKQQLLTFSSFAAVKASWAADYWQRKQTAKKIIAGLHP